jgi:hypothetical protein
MNRRGDTLVSEADQCDRQRVVGGELGRRWDVLRGSKPDLAADIQHLLNPVSSHTQVAPGLKEAQGDVFGRPDACGKGTPKQATPLDQLGQSVGHLQEEIEDLAGRRIAGVGVFQFKPPFFWTLKP